MKILYILLVCSICFNICIGQNTIRGKIISSEIQGSIPVAYANIRCLEKPYTAVLSDSNGNFQIQIQPNIHQFLIVSAVTFRTDTIKIEAFKTEYSIRLQSTELKEVTIRAKQSGKNMESTHNIEVIGLKEIKTAACCNLSEAFEKSASVDVIYSDAVTGAKEIRMLGLDGYYSQIMCGNQQAIRGLNTTFGLLYIPGQWMKGISVTKGIGSVINGYESISGQINVENKKPWASDLFSLNLFASHQGYFELNSDFSYRLSDKASSITFLHAEGRPFKTDFNKDQFADNPIHGQLNLLHQWKFNGKKMEGEISAQTIQEKRRGGQMQYLKTKDGYGIGIDNRRYEINAKTGFIFKDNRSVGIQYKLFMHEEDAFFGSTIYKGRQQFANINTIYQTEIGSCMNTLRVGASYTFDRYNERLDSFERKRTEHIGGIFAEYSYKLENKLNIICGLRVDYNSRFGNFISPRIHIKYDPIHNFSIRLGAGKGYRSPNIFAENTGVFASNRQIQIASDLSYESAWNYGISLTKNFDIKEREWYINVDFYRTDFQKQIIADRENPYIISFYNLKGKSFANSLQVELSAEPVKQLQVKLAWKYDDVWITYQDGIRRKPLQPIYKLLGTMIYTTPNKKWTFAYTTQYYSKARIPSTLEKPEIYRLPSYSKGFFNLSAQINYSINKLMEIYLGAENMLNYMQPNAILDSGNPFGRNFDASLIYGPIDGVRVYMGFRYNLPYEKGNRKLK